MGTFKGKPINISWTIPFRTPISSSLLPYTYVSRAKKTFFSCVA